MEVKLICDLVVLSMGFYDIATERHSASYFICPFVNWQ